MDGLEERLELERRNASLEEELRDVRRRAQKNEKYFRQEVHLLEGLIRLKEEDLLENKRLLKASQGRCERLLNELRECRRELLQRHAERLTDQITIVNLRARNSELSSSHRLPYNRTLYASPVVTSGVNQSIELADMPAMATALSDVASVSFDDLTE